MGRYHRARIYLLVVGGIVAIALLVIMVRIDQPLRTTGAPHGIVSFELAGSHEAARGILKSWGPEGRRNATLSLRLDYAFLIAYAMVISILCGVAAGVWPKGHPRIRRTGIILAGCQWLAALLDAIENILLQNILSGSTTAYLPLVARWCALAKFALIGCGWLYILLSSGIRVVGHFKSQTGRFGH